MNWLCDNDVARDVGAVTYTQCLNARGGIECDFTVTRTGADSFLVVTGTAFGSHDLAWIRRQAPASQYGSPTSPDSTPASPSGGRAPATSCAELTPADLVERRLPLPRPRSEITVGDVPVRALRVTFVGELGWELYCSGRVRRRAVAHPGRAPARWSPPGTRRSTACGWRRATGSGARTCHPTTPRTRRASDSASSSTSPAGSWAGKRCITANKTTRLRSLTLNDPRAVCLGNEPVRVDGAVVGRVTSGGYGYTVGRSIALAYLPTDLAEVGTPVEVEFFGEWLPGTVARDALYDPKSERVRS